jgi:hypothetical protein
LGDYLQEEKVRRLEKRVKKRVDSLLTRRGLDGSQDTHKWYYIKVIYSPDKISYLICYLEEKWIQLNEQGMSK